jgi:hypothetical protein
MRHQEVKAAFGRLSTYDLSEYGNNGTNHTQTQLACIKGDAQNAPRQAAAHSQQD